MFKGKEGLGGRSRGEGEGPSRLGEDLYDGLTPKFQEKEMGVGNQRAVPGSPLTL